MSRRLVCGGLLLALICLLAIVPAAIARPRGEARDRSAVDPGKRRICYLVRTRYRDAAEAAARSWSRTGPVAIREAGSRCKVTLRIRDAHREGTGGETCGSYNPANKVIALDPTDIRRADDLKREIRVQGVIAHELGHALGLDHLGPGTLMYVAHCSERPYIVEPGNPDIARYREIWG